MLLIRLSDQEIRSDLWFSFQTPTGTGGTCIFSAGFPVPQRSLSLNLIHLCDRLECEMSFLQIYEPILVQMVLLSGGIPVECLTVCDQFLLVAYVKDG